MHQHRNGPPAPLLPLNQLIAIDTVMLLGIAVLCWYALHVAGFAPPVPLMAPRAEVVKLGQQMVVYSLAVVACIDYVVLACFFQQICRGSAASNGRQSTPLTLRFAWAASTWMFVIILWFMMHPEAGLNP